MTASQVVNLFILAMALLATLGFAVLVIAAILQLVDIAVDSVRALIRPFRGHRP